MYISSLNDIFIDMFVVFLIFSTIVILTYFYSSRYQLSLPAPLQDLISTDRRIQNQYYWLLIVTIVYFSFKLFIYNVVFETVEAKVVDAQERYALSVGSNIGNKYGHRQKEKIFKVSYPILQARINNEEVEFDFDLSYSVGEIKKGDIYTVAYMTYLGGPIYENYGGLYFFRHDSICISLLLIVLLIIRMHSDNPSVIYNENPFKKTPLSHQIQQFLVVSATIYWLEMILVFILHIPSLILGPIYPDYL